MNYKAMRLELNREAEMDRQNNIVLLSIKKRDLTEALVRSVENLFGKSKYILLTTREFNNLLIQFPADCGEFRVLANKRYLRKYSINLDAGKYLVYSKVNESICSIDRKIVQLKQLSKDFMYWIVENDYDISRVMQILENDNSMNLINKGNAIKYKKLNALIEIFYSSIVSQGGDIDRYIVDSSAVMGLYGIRKVNDLDYLTDLNHSIFFDSKEIDNHIDCVKFHKVALEDLLYNPSNFLYYKGVKFISLTVLKEYKEARGEKKDVEDVKLIEIFEKNDKSMMEIWYVKRLQIKKQMYIFKKRVAEKMKLVKTVILQLYRGGGKWFL